MSEVFKVLAKKNPDLLHWVVKYLRMWWHGSICDGEEDEEGGDGVIRFQAGVI